MRDEKSPGTLECERFHTELEDYLEGENRPRVKQHAQQCSSCALVLADLEELRRVAGALPLEEPSPALWSNIRAALREEGLIREPQGRWAWLGQWGFLRHAGALAALAGLLAVGTLLTRSPSHLERSRVELPPAAPVATVAVTAPAGPEDTAWVKTIQQLEESYNAREPYLEPDLKVTYRKSLDSLNGCISECLASLKTEPTNTLARDYLLAAYTQKAELLTSAIEFSGR